ncbi:FecR domain-containing protein [Variovorax sp. H27-G14]|uniref:FecR domain-containing protein n=1 Tax=Variovorax sp. H27-G14 TaxID=3111914 RepID=UPI0038FCD4E3
MRQRPAEARALQVSAQFPSPPDTGEVLPEAIVEQAIGWYVQRASGLGDAQDPSAFARWHAAHPDHAHAWQRLQAMGQQLRGSSASVEPAVTRATLGRAATVSARRRTLKTLMWVGTGGTALYLVQDQFPWRSQFAGAWADMRTATGERRSMVLSDGSTVLMNTGTALDVRFDARERRLVLHRGEIMVATARDAARRPFVVSTRDGSLTPVGTRFTVRRDEPADDSLGFTALGVSEGAVEIRTANGNPNPAPPTLVRAGRQARFTRHHVDTPEALQEASQSWTDGTLTAEGMPLGRFIAELDRYRPGRLRCSPEVAGLRITGAWPLDGSDPTERILESLARRLPVKVTRLTRYWVTVSAR